MENESPTDDGRQSKRGRMLGKLFGRDKKVPAVETSNNNDKDLQDFFHGQGDKLEVNHAAPPVLAKLDIASATRYPNSLTVDGPGAREIPQQHEQQHLNIRPRPHSTRVRNRKGLVVRFVDTYPEIIGYGGDECEIPSVEVSRAKRTRPPPVTTMTMPPRAAAVSEKSQRLYSGSETARGTDEFEPSILRRTQTGFSSTPDTPRTQMPRAQVAAGVDESTSLLGAPGVDKNENRKSFIELHQVEMRQAEGRAFADAVRSASASSRHVEDQWEQLTETITESPVSEDVPSERQVPQNRQIPSQPSPQPPSQPPSYPLPTVPKPPPHALTPQSSQSPQQVPPAHHPESPESSRVKKTQALDQSPSSSVYSQSSLQSTMFRNPSRRSERDAESPASPSPYKASLNLHDVVVAAGDDAMGIFVTRTRHLFELFRLHSESVRPLQSCALEDLARAGLWWFLRGRMALENVIRDRPTDPEGQRRNENARQQAYADLAKAYWLSEEIIPEITEAKHLQFSLDVEDARKAIVYNLRKLAVSMKRNGFLPPEEALLPAHLERSIWLEYPQLTQDIIYLLWGSSGSGLSQLQQRPSSGMALLETLPLGDTPSLFCFGRVHADVYLMEDGMESQRFYFSCLLSITRPLQQPDIVFVIANQNGAMQLRISGNKKLGPTWDDVKWRPNSCTVDIRLPRGFVLVVQCSPPDYTLLRSMYDFSAQVQATLWPRKDEHCVFRSTLRVFQYFDNDPQARQFPRDSVPNCDLALFERFQSEPAATGPRTFHRGYRIAVVTGPKTKTLSGVNQTYYPHMPIQFGFLRGENNYPALSITFENGKLKGSMVMSFGDEKERMGLHRLLSGAAVRNDEQVCCETPVQGVWFSEKYGETNSKALVSLSNLGWLKARVINDDPGERASCILAEKLRVIFEFKDGTVTDRVNVAPGELKLRLDVRNPTCLMIFRQPQADLTLAYTETKSSRDRLVALSQALEALQQSPTIRTYMFTNIGDLHSFQAALTGFTILYDGVAAAFAIARRRMVVPIHKKWEAGLTRIQIVQQDGVMQLLAFFEDFAHGQSMSFQLKGTDVYEAFSRSGKAGLKIDDAKFPLPKHMSGTDGNAQAAAEAAFLCLDLPELPGEHDDISILFDNEADRQKLLDCLPAAVKGSRMSRIKGLKD